MPANGCTVERKVRNDHKNRVEVSGTAGDHGGHGLLLHSHGFRRFGRKNRVANRRRLRRRLKESGNGGTVHRTGPEEAIRRSGNRCGVRVSRPPRPFRGAAGPGTAAVRKGGSLHDQADGPLPAKKLAVRNPFQKTVWPTQQQAVRPGRDPEHPGTDSGD